MSAKERRRVEVFSRVGRGELKLAKAAELLGLSYRQAKRVWSAYRSQGDRGLVHGLRGRRSNRRVDGLKRQRVLEIYREKYADFGPTLAAEYLQREDGIAVAVETLRGWLLAEGLWRRRRQAADPHRRWRARREHRGELAQMDGSHHDWFEGRRAEAVLMVMIDDATGAVFARFFERETAAAAFEVFGRYAAGHGLPRAVYVDRDSIYRTTRQATVDESLAQEPPLTQFGRAMGQLDVELICAHSPQAKGRVERMNGTLQDRLVKALRLRGIATLEEANAFLEGEFLPGFNERFAVAPHSAADLHRRVPRSVELALVLSFQERRVVQGDGTVRWRNRRFQLVGRGRPRPKRRVLVCEQLDGQVRVLAGSREVSWEELPQAVPASRKADRKKADRKKADRSGPWKPPADHPWRQSYQGGLRDGLREDPAGVGAGSAAAR